MVRASCLLANCALITLLLFVSASAYPSPSYYFREDQPYEPEEMSDIMNNIDNFLLERKLENSYKGGITSSYKGGINSGYKGGITSAKRAGLDIGLNRGYSGAIQAKHLMAMLAANYAGGPGRRRRDVN